MKSEVYIIGGGNSVLDIDRSKLAGKDLIAINKSIIEFPEAKYFISMDHSFLKKLDLKRRILLESKAIKVFIANLVPEYIRTLAYKKTEMLALQYLQQLRLKLRQFDR